MDFESNLVNGYEESFKVAYEELKKRDMQMICLSSGAFYDKIEDTICISYLNKDYLINCSNGSVTIKASGKEATATERALILHYLVKAENRPLSGHLISFKEIPGAGTIYYQTYYKRSIVPLVKSFSGDPDRFYKAINQLGGTKETYGHASGTIKVFPSVPVTYVLWEGDDEVEASGTILFDESITSFLPDEDIIVAASFGVYEMIMISK